MVPVNFAVGDIVRLKSGGEKMIVRALDSSHHPVLVECLKFDGHGALRQKFPASELEVLSSGAAPPESGLAVAKSSPKEMR